MTVEDDLAHLRAGLDEDEAVARETLHVNIRADMLRGKEPPRWESFGREVRDSGPRGIVRVGHTWAREATHIARHDPARVLRQIKAMRAILEMAEMYADAEFPNFEGGYASAAEDALMHLAAVYKP